MAALLARFRFVRWVFLLLAASASVGCASFDNYDDCEEGDYDTAGYHRGGSVSPGVLNMRAGYRNG